MQDLFNEGPTTGQGAPSMLMGDGQPNFSDYRYRVERFSLGGADEFDEVSGMEALLTRSIQPDRNVVIIERKDSISATTGVYTCIIIYMEKILHQEGVTDA